MFNDRGGPMLHNYWTNAAPSYRPRTAPLPPAVDVAVIGGGFSGLAVAEGLARAGRSVVVLEAGTIGHGASSRSGGMVGPSFHKLGLAGLTARYGQTRAEAIMRAGIDALDHCQDLFQSLGVDVDLALTGRFRGARTEADMTAMIAECERLRVAVGLQYDVVARADLAGQTGAACYVGGVRYPRDGGIHPVKLVQAGAARAEAAGALLLPQSPVAGISGGPGAFDIAIPDRNLRAAEVVVCTNGYSGAGVRAMRERVVPIDITVAATRDLGPERIRQMSPRLQMHGETGRVFTWSRPTPDGRRFIFGGRLSTVTAGLARQQAQVAAAVGRIHPDLRADDFEQIWTGRIAYTTDHAPHLNRVDGLWLMGGYCGSGVTRSFFFADKLVRKMTGRAGGETPFDDLDFPRVPFRPLAPFGARQMTKYYAWRDRRDRRA
ncbi:NAD(P)/FAD-dependent oxidoreductase [Thioclava kandeliae]|uniref:FAD-binding oxidoreductase n=1 Tax=Thioclava kandeliae TaxID=3070818 RepID=A0ABV1SL86_9RHOB